MTKSKGAPPGSLFVPKQFGIENEESQAKKLKIMIEELEAEKKEYIRYNQHLQENSKSVRQDNIILEEAIRDRKAYLELLKERYFKSIKKLDMISIKNQRIAKIYYAYRLRIKNLQLISNNQLNADEQILKYQQKLNNIENRLDELMEKYPKSEIKTHYYKVLLSLISKLSKVNDLFTCEARNCLLKKKSKRSKKQPLYKDLQKKIDKINDVNLDQSKLTKTNDHIGDLSDQLKTCLPTYAKVLHIIKLKSRINEISEDDEFDTYIDIDSINHSKSRSYLKLEKKVSKIPKTVEFDEEIETLKRIVGGRSYDYLSDPQKQKEMEKLYNLIEKRRNDSNKTNKEEKDSNKESKDNKKSKKFKKIIKFKEEETNTITDKNKGSEKVELIEKIEEITKIEIVEDEKEKTDENSDKEENEEKTDEIAKIENEEEKESSEKVGSSDLNSEKFPYLRKYGKLATRKSDKSEQVDFIESSESDEKLTLDEEDNMTEDYQLKIPSDKRKDLVDAQTSTTFKDRRRPKPKHVSTYDPKIFRTSQFEPKNGRFTLANAPPIKLNVTLKDIGMEGLDSYANEIPKEEDKQSHSKSEAKKIEDIEKLNEEMRRRKITEAWKKRKELEKKINTYDPKIFRASAFSPTAAKKLNPEDIPPIKLNVELKDIGLEGLDSIGHCNAQEVKPRSPPQVDIKDEVEIARLEEEMRMKKVQEEWKKRKEMEKKINTYDPKIFRASAFSPTAAKKLNPEDIPPIKLNVELKDIGLEGLDSFRTGNEQDEGQVFILETSPKKETKEEDNEETRRRKITEEWKKRKELEKKINTYDPRIFRTSAFSPTTGKLNPEDIPPIKLNVDLKDIGLEGLDSYRQEFQPHSPPKETTSTEKPKTIQQPRRTKKKDEKQASTYDPKIFESTLFTSPTSKLKQENIKPVKLTVTLKDIGLEGLDSYQAQVFQLELPPTENEEKKNKEENENDEKFVVKQPTETSSHSNFRAKRKQTENTTKSTTKSTYDPSVFRTSFYTNGRLKQDDIKPIKLNVTLKDIGLEGLDSYTPQNSQDFKPKNPKMAEIRKPKDCEAQNEAVSNVQKNSNSNVRIQKVNDNNNKRKNEKTKRKSTYDPSIFNTTSCAFKSAQLTAKKIEPVKLNVTLKDIGLEGLDSF